MEDDSGVKEEIFVYLVKAQLCCWTGAAVESGRRRNRKARWDFNLCVAGTSPRLAHSREGRMCGGKIPAKYDFIHCVCYIITRASHAGNLDDRRAIYMRCP